MFSRRSVQFCQFLVCLLLLTVPPVPSHLQTWGSCPPINMESAPLYRAMRDMRCCGDVRRWLFCPTRRALHTSAALAVSASSSAACDDAAAAAGRKATIVVQFSSRTVAAPGAARGRGGASTWTTLAASRGTGSADGRGPAMSWTWLKETRAARPHTKRMHLHLRCRPALTPAPTDRCPWIDRKQPTTWSEWWLLRHRRILADGDHATTCTHCIQPATISVYFPGF